MRTEFVERFGESDATAIEQAAESHKNGIHDEPGSDYFRWAILIALGFQCMEVEGYREGHGIQTPWSDLREWLHTESVKAWLRDHDGQFDYLAAFGGAYNFIQEEPHAA